MKSKNFLALAWALVFSFTLNSDEYPWLSELDYQNEVFESGERLMQLEYGLHALEEKLNNEDSLIIAVHGSRSRGYEWIYPMKTLDSKNHYIYFFRRAISTHVIDNVHAAYWGCNGMYFH